MSRQGRINCACGACALVLNDCTPVLSLLCACEDCRQALQWAENQGGAPAVDICHSVYSRSDIPIFHTAKYPQERKRLFDITAVREAFSPPQIPAKGQTIREVIASFPEIEVLGLAPGARP